MSTSKRLSALLALLLIGLAGCWVMNDGHHDAPGGVLCFTVLSIALPALPLLGLLPIGWAPVALLPSVLSAVPPVRLPPPKLARS